MRKATTPIHIAIGVLAALVARETPALALMLFGGFAVYEYWSERHGHTGGYQDFWEALLGLGIAATMIVALEAMS